MNRQPVTPRRSLLVSHQPMGAKTLKDLTPLPEERQHARGVRHRPGRGYATKTPAYSGWSLSVEVRSLSSVAASPISGAALASEFGAAFGFSAVICTLYDVYLTEKNRQGDWRDYLAGALMLHHERARLEALKLAAEHTGTPARPEDKARLELNILALTQILTNFEDAYYRTKELPFLARVRQEIADSAGTIASSLAGIEGLSIRRRATVEAFMEADDRDTRERLSARLGAIDNELQAHQHKIEDSERRVKRLMSRRRLRQRAKAQLAHTRVQRDKARELAQEHASMLALAEEAITVDIRRLKHPGDTRLDARARQLDTELQACRQRRIALEHGLPEWRKLLLAWTAQHLRAHPGEHERTALLQQLVDGLEAEMQHLQEEVEAFGCDWARPFHPYQGLGQQAIKNLRDVQIQLPRAVVDATNVSVSLAQHFLDLVGGALGSYGLGVLSAILALLMARGETRDSRWEQAKATQAKLDAWTLLCRAAELERGTRSLAAGHTRALVRAVCTTLSTQAQRSLKVQHRATQQGQTRGAKGKLSYVLIVFALVGGAVAMGTGGATLAFWAIPQAVLSSLYLGTIGWRAAQTKGDQNDAKARHALARAFVRRFGMPAVMRFYIDVDSGDAARIDAWRPRLIELRDQWTRLHTRQEHFEANDVFYRIGHQAFEPMVLWDNEFLAMVCVTQQLHRHARDRLSPPGTAAQLLGELGMDERIVALLAQNLAGFVTPAQHELSTQLHIAHVYGAKLHPGHRLPGHVDRPPRLSAPLAERALGTLWDGLSPPTRRAIDELLQDMQALPAQAIQRLARAPKGVRQALKHWLDAVRQALHRHFVGPQELLDLQKLLVELQAAQSVGGPHRPPQPAFPLHDRLVLRAGPGPGADPLKGLPLPLLRAPTGPLLLELLADPSYLDPLAHLPAGTLPPVSRGPQMLAHLIQAMKTVGRKLRDGDLDPGKDALDQRVRPGKALGKARPASATLRPPQPADALIEWTGALPPGGPGLVHRIRRSAGERYRRASKSLEQMTKNPFATPGRALRHLDGLRHEDHRARLCGWVLRECLRLYLVAWPRPAGVAGQAWVQAVLRAVRTTAQQTGDSLRDRLAPVWRRGVHAHAPEQRFIERLDDMATLCERLLDSLSQPLTQAQFADLLEESA